jgi:hypothetical protein
MFRISLKVSVWPTARTDFNPFDYELWSILEKRVCKKRHINLESLKRSIVKTTTEIPLEMIRIFIEQ